MGGTLAGSVRQEVEDNIINSSFTLANHKCNNLSLEGDQMESDGHQKSGSLDDGGGAKVGIVPCWINGQGFQNSIFETGGPLKPDHGPGTILPRPCQPIGPAGNKIG